MGSVSMKEIEDFFWHKSERAKRFRMFNFLYEKTDECHKANGFSTNTLDEATKKIDELKSRLNTVNEALQQELEIQLDEQQLISEILTTADKDQIKKQWEGIVEKIHKHYLSYLDKMKSKEIKYIIISEAPKLTIKEDQLNCNYIFDNENDQVGFYRDAPYHALGGINKEPKANDLITLYCAEGVAFLDLVPIPLPELTTDLRSKWGFDENFNVGGLPRSIVFLKIAFEYFLTKTSPTFNNPKIALMMPPKTGSGIINFFMDKKNKTGLVELDDLRDQIIQENNNANILKYNIPHTAWKLHKAICTNGANSPQENMIKNALELKL